jgi:uncharacterized membrane protein YphA (DoxX/SURF4 family)
LRLLGGVMNKAMNPWATRLRWLCLLLLCAAYLQGGLVKLFDFPGAVGEMAHFGLQPAPLFAVAVIVLELGAAALILSGRLRWLGALVLAVFTAAATFMANRYWAASGHERFMLMNAFFEHWGLVGGFLLVAWHDWQDRRG